jgi:hypothetical protein
MGPSSGETTLFSPDDGLIVTQNMQRLINIKGKGKAVPLQAWGGPGGFQEVKVPRFCDNGTGWW